MNTYDCTVNAGERISLKFAIMLNPIEDGGLEAAAFTVENGELKSAPVDEGFTDRFLRITLKAPGKPLLVFDSGKHLFLEELWSVLRPDKTWNGVPGGDAIENWSRVLQELWQEAKGKLDRAINLAFK